MDRLTRYALIWSGVRVAPELSHWVTTDHGYGPGTRLPRVTLPVHGKRLSMRVVPDGWRDEFDTPFMLHRQRGDGTAVSAIHRGLTIPIAKPTLRYRGESVQTLAYAVEHSGPEPKKSITVNPLQRCPQTCEFCCRGYHDMTSARKSELINLAPDEMARLLLVKFRGIKNWEDVSGITLVTGDFKDGERILSYMEEFVGVMGTLTAGQWDPAVHSHQDISVSTHLLRTRDVMERAKAIGMKRFIHTVEMVSDDEREAVMHLGQGPLQSTPKNKGHSTFADSLRVLQTAIDIFGAENVEPVLVVGLDSLEKTQNAMDGLKAIGITHVSRGLINIYNMNQFGLLPVPFEEAVAGMQYARDLFASQYRRTVGSRTSLL